MGSQSAAAQSPGPRAGSARREQGAAERAGLGPAPERSGEAARAPQPSPSPAGGAAPTMEPDHSPRKIQFTVPLLEPHLDPEAAEQIRRRRPTPATLVLTSDQSSPEIDEDRIPNPLLKSTLSMSPRQRKKVTRITPTMKELQMMVEHHLGQQQQGEEPEGATGSTETQESGPTGITDVESKLGTSGKVQEPAESIPKILEQDSEEQSTEDPSAHTPPLGSQGAK